MKTIAEQQFVIFDVETTGLSPASGDRIIEIAALKVNNLKPAGKFYSLINPEREISWGAYQVNGISEAMVAQAPKAKEILPEFIEFIDGGLLVGHNVKFDLGFLSHELSLLGLPWQETAHIDTIKMARALLPGLTSYSLAAVSYALGIDTVQQHRAMSDVELTFSVFRHLLENAARKELNSPELILNLFSHHKDSPRAPDPAKVALIQEVIQTGQALNLLYFSLSSSSTSLRKVTPRKIVGNGAQMMLVGFCHRRQAELSFKIQRILNAERMNS